MFLSMGVICNACLEVKGTGSFILEVSMMTFSGTAMREERLFALGIVKQLKAAVQQLLGFVKGEHGGRLSMMLLILV